jgi:hypothetical protein
MAATAAALVPVAAKMADTAVNQSVVTEASTMRE